MCGKQFLKASTVPSLLFDFFQREQIRVKLSYFLTNYFVIMLLISFTTVHVNTNSMNKIQSLNFSFSSLLYLLLALVISKEPRILDKFVHNFTNHFFLYFPLNQVVPISFLIWFAADLCFPNCSSSCKLLSHNLLRYIVRWLQNREISII